MLVPHDDFVDQTGNGRRCQRSWSWCCLSWLHRKRKWSGMPCDLDVNFITCHGFPAYTNVAWYLMYQVRFELTFFALNPKLNVVAPWREWDITGREDAIEYAKKHNVPVPVTKKSIYSRDRNLWHLSHEVTFISSCTVFPRCYRIKSPTNLIGSHCSSVLSKVSWFFNQCSFLVCVCRSVTFVGDDLISACSMPLKGDILEDPANEPRKDMYMMTVDPEDAPNKPE